jgi:hypothetical protein
MKGKLLTYKWTCLLGVAFLGSLLWSGTLAEGFIGFFLVLLFFLSFLVSTIVSVGLAVAQRSRESFYRVAINAIIFLLLLPTINLGSFLRDRLFLMRLPTFQEATELLIKSEKAKVDSGGISTLVPLPASYSNLNVLDRVEISSVRGNVTIRYFNRGSSALGHSGYMYRSDDDPTLLDTDYPKTGYTRVAPHWFFFSE